MGREVAEKGWCRSTKGIKHTVELCKEEDISLFYIRCEVEVQGPTPAVLDGRSD